MQTSQMLPVANIGARYFWDWCIVCSFALFPTFNYLKKHQIAWFYGVNTRLHGFMGSLECRRRKSIISGSVIAFSSAHVTQVSRYFAAVLCQTPVRIMRSAGAYCKMTPPPSKEHGREKMRQKEWGPKARTFFSLVNEKMAIAMAKSKPLSNTVWFLVCKKTVSCCNACLWYR
jgi:hypothetical protein